MMLVRKDRNGHAISSRVAARWMVLSANTFSVTTITSTWNFETIRSGPANCISTGCGWGVFSDSFEDVESQHVEDAEPEVDEGGFGGSILLIANVDIMLWHGGYTHSRSLYTSLCRSSVVGPRVASGS
jgi:hypothetical protein